MTIFETVNENMNMIDLLHMDRYLANVTRGEDDSDMLDILQDVSDSVLFVSRKQMVSV